MLVQYYYKKISTNDLHPQASRLSPDFPLAPQPAYPFPLSPRLPPASDDWRESKKDAGGSKRPYEATFWIAMKGGRRNASTAANAFTNKYDKIQCWLRNYEYLQEFTNSLIPFFHWYATIR